MERTLFLLDYMSDADMRRHIRAETTKVESYNQFTDWIAFGGPVLRSGDPVEQEKRIKYRDLVANAVMLHNVVDMTNVLPQTATRRHLRDAGDRAAPEPVSDRTHQAVWTVLSGYGHATGTFAAAAALWCGGIVAL